eukprot:ANDGO_06875.mRNA.1 hypothetical protein
MSNLNSSPSSFADWEFDLTADLARSSADAVHYSPWTDAVEAFQSSPPQIVPPGDSVDFFAESLNLVTSPASTEHSTTQDSVVSDLSTGDEVSLHRTPVADSMDIPTGTQDTPISNSSTDAAVDDEPPQVTPIGSRIRGSVGTAPHWLSVENGACWIEVRWLHDSPSRGGNFDVTDDGLPEGTRGVREVMKGKHGRVSVSVVFLGGVSTDVSVSFFFEDTTGTERMPFKTSEGMQQRARFNLRSESRFGTHGDQAGAYGTQEFCFQKTTVRKRLQFRLHVQVSVGDSTLVATSCPFRVLSRAHRGAAAADQAVFCHKAFSCIIDALSFYMYVVTLHIRFVLMSSRGVRQSPAFCTCC